MKTISERLYITIEKETTKSNMALILVPIIGCIGTIVASSISVIGNINMEKIRVDAEQTKIALISVATQGGVTEVALQSTINAPPISTATTVNTLPSTPVPQNALTLMPAGATINVNHVGDIFRSHLKNG